MKSSHIIKLAREAIRNAAKTSNRTVHSVMRLDDALLARTPSDDIGETSVEAVEVYPRILQTIKAPSRESSRNTIVLGIDSSSRVIDVPGASIIVGAVSISSNRKPSLGDWPPLFDNPIPGLNEPFITILPNTDEYRVEENDYVTTKNPAGVNYNGDYSIYQALDEARVRLENKTMMKLAEVLAEAKLKADVIVLVDGPLYLVTGAITRPGVPYEYRVAWKHLYWERIKAVEMLEKADARVYGIVKRIERATLMQRDPRLDSRIKSCIGDAQYNDKLILYRSLERPPCRRIAPPNGGYALVSSYLKVRYNGVGAEKVAQYVVVPQPRWTPNPHASKYYRVEESYSAWRENNGYWKEYRSPASGLLLDSVTRGSSHPVTITYSDRRAKEITSYLKSIMIMEAAKSQIPISYSNEIEVTQIWARVKV